MLWCSDLSSLWLTTFLSSFISLSAVFDQEVYQLFQMTCSLFELLIELFFDHLLGTVTSTCWQDTFPAKQQWQGLMCFIPGCLWESCSPSKVCGIYLCTFVAPYGHCTGKHHVREYRMYQVIINIAIICSESSWHWRVEHSPNPSLPCSLDSLLRFLRDNAPPFSQDYRLYLWFSDHAYKHYDELNLGW